MYWPKSFRIEQVWGLFNAQTYLIEPPVRWLESEIVMKDWIAVAAGGMLGAVLRHALSTLFSLISPSWLLFATLAANVLGCFAIGWLAQWSFQSDLFGAWWVVGIRVGFLGGLTTFSSFGLELVRLWQAGRTLESLGLGATHLVVGIAAVVAGMTLARIPGDGA